MAVNCAGQEIGGRCDCGPKCPWAYLRARHGRAVEGPIQLIELDARAAGAPGWVLRVEEVPGLGWLGHIKHVATGNLVPRGPQVFSSRELALAEAARLAAI